MTPRAAPPALAAPAAVALGALLARKGTRVRCSTLLSGAAADIDIVFTDTNKFRVAQTRVRNPG